MISNNIYRGRSLRKAFGILALIFSLAGSVGAETWTVDDSGGANFTRIQDAIDNASAGDTILVYSGTYYENVDVNMQLILRGIDNGGGMPVVDAGGRTGGVCTKVSTAITLSAGWSTIEGITAINSCGFDTAGIRVISNNNIIRNNTVLENNDGIRISSSNNILNSNNASNNDVGIRIEYSSNNTLSSNIADSNSDYGIYLVSSGNNLLSANTASNNFAGIRLDASSNNMLKENTANLSFGYGFYVVSFSNNNTLTGNTALNNGAGIYLHSSNNNSLNSNIVSNNNGGIFLQYSSSDNFLNNNTISYSSIGVSVGSFSNNNTFDSNTISNNNYGIDLAGFSNDDIIYNKFYNNIFNNNNTVTIFSSINKWNTTKTIGKNIIGGPYLGGNFWANPSGTGFSQICADVDANGMCDSSYILDANNIDHLPLTTAAGGLLSVHNLDTGENFSTIKAAIDDVDTLNGHIIIVDAGTYIENVGVYKQLTIRSTSENPDDTIVQAANPAYPVFAVNASYVSIRGFTVEGATGYQNAGIYLGNNVNNCNISNNKAFNNEIGIYLSSSSNNNTLNNIFANSNYFGIWLDSSINNNLNNNTAESNMNSGIYLYSSSGNKLRNNSANSNYDYGIYLSSSSNNNILEGNTVNSNYYKGIWLDSSSNNMLSGNNISNNYYGILIESNSNNIMSTNDVFNNFWGFYLWGSNNNILSSNNAISNTVSIRLESSNDNIVSDNNATNSEYGIYLISANNNIVNNNIAYSNNENGIRLESSNDNTIYNNYFNNTNNAWDDGSNIWNTAKTLGTNIIGGAWLGGNYWSDYAGKDLDRDSLGDTLIPYNSADGITSGGDYLPLVLSVANQPPVADFIYSPLNPNVNQTITFDGSLSYDSDGNITSYWWNISGNIFTTKIVNISFPVPGTYYAGLMVTDNDGATNSTAKWINVQGIPSPPAIISWSNSKTNDDSLAITVNESETIRFNATANQIHATWNWYLNNINQNNNVDNFSCHFASSGNYTLKVNATNANGSSNTVIWNINVQAPPPIQANVIIKPETLNLASNGVFTIFIQLTEGYNVADIDISTVECEGAIAISGNMDGDTYVVKFNREDLKELTTGEAIKIRVTGKVYYKGKYVDFYGYDTIRVMKQGEKKI